MPTTTNNDLWLFQQIAKGDETAFEEVFYRYMPKLKVAITGIVKLTATADEIVQDVFLKLWMNREHLEQVKEPGAWLFRIASNLSLNHLRRQAVEYKYLKEAMHAACYNGDDILQQLNAKQLQEFIAEAIHELPEKRKQVYLLSREEGLSHREISERLGISLSTVKNQMVMALKNIQEHILKRTGIYLPLILLVAKIKLPEA